MNDSSSPTPRSLVGEDLRDAYRERLGPRIANLEEALESLGTDPVGAEEALRRAAHVLRGSGASYGYPEVTRRAATLEDAPKESIRSACEALLDELRAVAKDPRGPTAPVILVIEEDPEIRHLLHVVLAGEGRDVVAVDQATSAMALLEARPVRLVVLDLFLTESDGRELLRRIREYPRTADVPVIVLGAHGSPQVRAECFALGADAYFRKPFDPDVLASVVATHLGRSLAKHSESTRDVLTGLLNRSGLREAYDGIETSCERVVAIVELDGFDRVQERAGWPAADAALRAVGRLIGEVAVENGGWAGRWEGETFVLVLSEAPSVATPRIESTVARLRRVPVQGHDGETFRVTASAGVGAGTGANAFENLMDIARGGVYGARENGGNRVGAPPSQAPRKRKVLVAEDDDLTASLLLHRLGREGFEVEWHSNGADAYEAALRGHPDLVVLDVHMPGMDGFELLERLRRVSVFQDVPVVLLTSQGAEADLVRGFRLGADDYVLKPFSPMEFVARIRRLVSRRR